MGTTVRPVTCQCRMSSKTVESVKKRGNKGKVRIEKENQFKITIFKAQMGRMGNSAQNFYVKLIRFYEFLAFYHVLHTILYNFDMYLLASLFFFATIYGA